MASLSSISPPVGPHTTWSTACAAFCGQRSIGHLGTLDPLATGVLPLVTGSLTRLAQFYTTSEKVYEGVIRFGFATDTYDADGEATSEPHPVTLTLDQLQQLSAADSSASSSKLRHRSLPRRFTVFPPTNLPASRKKSFFNPFKSKSRNW